MKKKLLVLSASAILASNFIFDNNASAVVKQSGYESEALQIEGTRKHDITLQQYKDSLEDLIMKQSLNEFGGYDEPEYKEAYQKYQGRFLAELEALNKFVHEDEKEKGLKPGMTQERYKTVYEALLNNKKEFEREASKIEQGNKELKRFNDEELREALGKVYDLEDKAYMVAKAFPDSSYKGARAELYNKIYLVVGYSSEERTDKLPINQRMVKEMCENLETIIDEFFKDIGHERPLNIEPLTDQNKDNKEVINKVRTDAENAKNNPNLVDPGVQQRADRAAERLAKMTKASKEAKENAAKAKATVKALQAQKAPTTKKSYTKNPDAFPHKQLKQHHDLKNELVIKEPTQQLPTYTVTTERQTQPVLKQTQREETFTLPMAPRQSQQPALKGMSGESNHVTTDADSKPSNQYGGNGNLIEFTEDTTPKAKGANNQKQTTTEDTTPEVKETITESNVVDIDQSSFYQKSGYKYGYSESDTSGYTDRDKRAIKRNLVREAEEKVNQYVNSQSAQDLVAAREKVKTLDSAQQTRLNKQIDKIYNGQY